MRKPVILGIGAVVVLLAAWLSVAGITFGRNAPPKVVLPEAEATPAGNVYDDYVKCVAGLPPTDKKVIGDFGNRVPLSAETMNTLVGRNASLLSDFHRLPGKPSMVTQLEPGAKFTPAQEFPLLNWLVGIEAETLRAKNDPARALHALLDGLTFSEDVLRGGATLHLGTTLMAQLPIAYRLPTLLPHLPAPVCEQGAERVKGLIAAQYPLKKILENERLVRVRQMIRTTEPNATRVLRLQVPTSETEWQQLLTPKAQAILDVNDYLRKWSEQADKPLDAMTAPALPESSKILTNDSNLEPGSFGGHPYRYRYKAARLHLMYAGLRLEAAKKRSGRYPATLAELGNDPLLNDPFTGKPLMYRREGSGFVLYSAGMNLKDDGNAPEISLRSMGPGSACDISFTPHFAVPARGRS
ncbi:MAG: hypothetical protein SFU56_04220 [Capsulimonadales bacterium]|nr:hypothetical protein [Capsulimonadales bacterium]